MRAETESLMIITTRHMTSAHINTPYPLEEIPKTTVKATWTVLRRILPAESVEGSNGANQEKPLAVSTTFFREFINSGPLFVSLFRATKSAEIPNLRPIKAQEIFNNLPTTPFHVDREYSSLHGNEEGAYPVSGEQGTSTGMSEEIRVVGDYTIFFHAKCRGRENIVGNDRDGKVEIGMG